MQRHHLTRFCKASALLLFLASVPTWGIAAVWTVYADESGDFATLQEAIDVAQSGDTILVGPGEHFGPFWIETKTLVLRSIDGPATTMLSGEPDLGFGREPVVHFFFEAETGSEIEGFTIQGGESGIKCSSASPIIRGNIIQGNGGPIGAGIGCHFGSAPLIEENLIWRNIVVYNCCFPSRGGGVYADDTSPAVIRRNVIAYNRCVGQCLGGGVTAFIGRIEGNTIVGNRADGPAGGVELPGEGLELIGNIIAYNRSKEFADGIMVQRTAVIGCNNVWGNGDEDYWGAPAGENDFSVDPRFCGIPSLSDADRAVLAAGMFNLRADSPCLPGQHPYGSDCGLIGARADVCGRGKSIPVVAADLLRPIIRIRPNPTRGGVHVQHLDPSAFSKTATMEVIDAAGRILRRAEPSPNGGFFWDGRTSQGDPVATGLYYVRIQAAGSRPSQGTVLVIR